MVRVCGDCMNILLELGVAPRKPPNKKMKCEICGKECFCWAIEIDTISLKKESINNLLTNMTLLDFTRWMKEKNGTKICKVEEANDDYIPSVMDEKLFKFIVRAIQNNKSYVTFKEDQ